MLYPNFVCRKYFMQSFHAIAFGAPRVKVTVTKNRKKTVETQYIKLIQMFYCIQTWCVERIYENLSLDCGLLGSRSLLLTVEKTVVSQYL